MISVLVVDDSAFMRKMISLIISSDTELNVCGVAKNGIEAVEKAISLKPDVITMDVDMPEMDGITALKTIMREAPTSVVMLSALTKKGSELTMEALESGAVDFITKPSGTISMDIDRIKDELITKIKVASTAKRIRKSAKTNPIEYKFSSETKKAVIIVTSTGGPSTLSLLIPRLSKGIPASIFVVQHMPPGFTQPFAERLNVISQLPVKEASDSEMIREGVVYLAPGGFHMIIELNQDRKEVVHLNLEPPVFGLRPYADYTISSIVDIYREKTICVILTGMGEDGTNGAKYVKKHNGKVFAEDEKDCVVYGMPRSAVRAGAVDEIVPLDLIPKKIMDAVNSN